MIPLNDLPVLYGRGVSSGVEDGELCGHVDLSMEREEIIITRIADVLVIQAIRGWLRHAPISERGWIAAFNDELIGRALALIHQNPAAPWSVAGLARGVGLSRSAFSARFSALVGVSAMSYVSEWRLQSRSKGEPRP